MRDVRISLHCRLRTMKFGYSALEALVVIGLVAVTAGVSIPLYRNYQIRSDLNLATDGIVQLLHRAQALARASEKDSAWGVYVQEGTLYSGNAYVLRQPTNDEVYGIPSTIDASGLPEVSFSQLEGIPNETGSIILTALSGEYREIIVDDFGIRSVSSIYSPPPLDGGGGIAGESSSSGDASSDGGQTSSDQSSSVSTSSDSSVTSQSSSLTSQSSTGGASSSPSSQGSSAVSSSTSSATNAEGTGADGEDASCELNYTVENGTVTTIGTNDITLKVLGSEITYGSNGPKIDVRMTASITNGSTWVDLYGGDPIKKNDTQQLTNIPGGTSLLLRFNGRYSWLFNKTYQSNTSQGHIYVLKNGDSVPQYAPFGNQQSLESYLKQIVQNGRITIGERDLVFLVELGGLDSNADFQDAVVLATFGKKATTCNSSNEPRVKISYNRIENSGNGNMSNKVYVGPNAIAFAEEQWIPLMANGQVIVDSGMQENVAGFALERGNGWIKIRSHGSHPNNGGKEIVDARALFNKAYITQIQNDTNDDASENPTDGITNDGSDGDEFVGGPNVKSMNFNTRVTTSDDGVIIYWTQGEPQTSSSSVSNSSASSTSNSSNSSASSVAVDACAVPFSIDPSGSINLASSADVTINVLGSESTYGYRGPRVQVRSRYSLDGGSTWQTLFGYRSLKGHEIVTYANVPGGSKIALEFSGRYSWLFNRVVQSGTGDDRVRVLLRGQGGPNVPLILSRSTLKSFVMSVLDVQNNVTIGSRQVLVLAELGDINNTADYQDAVVLLSIDKPGGCGDASNSSTSSSVSSTNSSASYGSSSDSSSSSSLAANQDTDGDTVSDALDLCPGTYLPESVPTEYMLSRRYALTAHDAIFRTGPRKKISQYTLESVKGCSCSQILDIVEGESGTLFESAYPALYRQLNNLFPYYVRSSRRFGCGEALMDMVSEAR